MTNQPRNPKPVLSTVPSASSGQALNLSKGPAEVSDAIIIVPIVGELTSETTPEDFRRFARLALGNRKGIDGNEISHTDTTHTDTAEDC